jgi:hypothetical protein
MQRHFPRVVYRAIDHSFSRSGRPVKAEAATESGKPVV